MVKPIDLQNVERSELERWSEEAAHEAIHQGTDVDLAADLWARRVVWLATYATTFDKVQAARAAGVSQRTATNWQTDDTVFQALLARANDQVSSTVAGEVYRRAVHGVSRGVWHQGQLVGTEQQYSDALLTTLAKRVDPAWTGEATLTDRSQAKLVAAVLADPAALAAAQVLADRLAELAPTQRPIEARQP